MTDDFTGLVVDCCKCGEEVRVEMSLTEYIFGQNDRVVECDNCGSRILLEREKKK